MNACSTLILGLCSTYVLLAQDLASCGDGYPIDLSVGYTVTGQGLQSCGCAPDTNYCELVHIIMREVRDGNTTLLSCPDISLTERWWRELKDLVDIYNPETCEQYPESDTHPDRYEFNTSDLNPGDTLSILVCKVSSFDNNIIELSASPSNECRAATCPPSIDCPAEFKLRKGFDCAYSLPDFMTGVSLTDNCVTPAVDVTDDYTIMQMPPAGTSITEDLFVEMRVYNDDGILITTCDVFVTLAGDPPPVMSFPIDIPDVFFGEELPDFEILDAHDTLHDGTIINIQIITTMESGSPDPCEGYPMTYKWMATDTCGNTTTREKTFNVLADVKAPIFVSVPVDIDTILAGEQFPLLVDLIAVNEDGSAVGVNMTKSIDPYTADLCQGYPVTYRWTATDSCNNTAAISKSFYVKPVNEPPLFVSIPQAINDIMASDPLPVPEILTATNAAGFKNGIAITQSIDPYIENSCAPYNITYRWVARDSCSNVASTSASFAVHPDTIDFGAMAAMEDMDLRIEASCEKAAAITVPIDLDRYNNLTIDISIFDDNWNLISNNAYTEDQEYNFEAGTSHVVYQFTDICDRTMNDTITVNAADVRPPSFDCNPNQEVYVSNFGTCSAIVNWAQPAVVDNCPDASITQVSGPISGATLLTGKYVIEYKAVDASGNESSCSFDIIVSAVPATQFLCEAITADLDSSCGASISRSFIISKLALGCVNNLGLVIKADQDTLLGEVVDLTDHIEKNITYTVCNPITGICCSEQIIIRDTIAPIITCLDPIAVFCYSDIDNYRPQVADCYPVTWNVSEQAVTNSCVNEDILAIINKTYIATDLSGNRSNSCSQQFVIRYAKIDSLDELGLVLFPKDTTIQCDNIDIDNSIKTSSGFPTINGIPIDPEAPICGLNITYTDDVIYANGCNKSIIRSWQITEDRCYANFAVITGRQYISVTDTIAPIISSASDTINLDTRVKECYGYLFQPAITTTDNCQDSETLIISYNYNNYDYDAYTPIPLPGGYNSVIVIATDDCGNQGYDTLIVNVQDVIRPVAVCYDDNVISLSGGIAKLSYASVDAGSYDNCDISSLTIRREENYCIPSDSLYGEYVHFCCDDIGKEVLVSLRVIDHAGNINICHSLVLVQDQTAPIITCPPDLTVSCEANIVPSDDTQDPYGYLFGNLKATSSNPPIGLNPIYITASNGPLVNGKITDECIDNITYSVATNADINNCGIGTITRTFTAEDQAGNISQPCTQTIIITGGEELDTSLITWPKTEVEVDVCNSTFDISPSNLGSPITQEKTCTLYGVSHEDTYFDVPGNNVGICSKIVRSWTIINWCSTSDHTGITKYQTIKISDNEIPVFADACNQQLYIKAQSIDCRNIPIELTLNTTDNCTPTAQLDITVQVDLNDSGIRDYTSANITVDSNGLVTWQDTLIAGDHKITWVVKDKCGNENRCSQKLTLEDSKPPTPYAHGLNITLLADGYVDIWASDLQVKASDPCGQKVETSITLATANFEDAQDNIRLTCKNIGETLIKVYAYRRLADGSVTSDFTTVTIDLQDNANICTAPADAVELTTALAGRVKTSYGVALPYAEVELTTKDEIIVMMADESGWYEHDNLSIQSYNVSPYIAGFSRAGLSTRDVILIQRHILGLTTLYSPWDLISADVTRNNTISASDIIELRKVLIGKESKMEDYPSWLFLRSDYRFADSQHAHEEEIDYNTFFDPEDGKQRIDFIGMKVGDLDKSITISNKTAKSRSVMLLDVVHSTSNSGIDTISLLLQEDFDLYGFQLSLDLGKNRNPEFINAPDGFELDYRQEQHVLHVSANNNAAKELQKGAPIITLVTSSMKSDISQVNINSSIIISKDGFMNAELYDGNLNAYELGLKQISNQSSKTYHHIHASPNPFSGTTTIVINSIRSESILLQLYDSQGNRLKTAMHQLTKGENKIPIQIGASYPKGALYYKFIAGGESIVGRIISI